MKNALCIDTAVRRRAAHFAEKSALQASKDGAFSCKLFTPTLRM
jgi:hypothetical protein